MNSPAAPKPGTTFDSIVAQAQLQLHEQQHTAFHALQMGVNPDEIIDYARGLSPSGFETVLTRSPWALRRVTALVRAARVSNSLGLNL